MGKSPWMSMEQMDLPKCRCEWAFGGAEVGKSERMSVGRIHSCLRPYEWAQRSARLGDREWMPGLVILMKILLCIYSQ